MKPSSAKSLLIGLVLLVPAITGAGFFLENSAVAVTAAAAACIGLSCFQVVTTGNECLVERFGKYKRKLGPGWHFVLRPLETVSFKATTREQIMDVPPQQCYTLDNAPLRADAVVYLRIFSSESARYAVDDISSAILNLCLTQLREEVGKLTLDETFSSRDRINKNLLKVMNEVCSQWGVQITRVEIQNLEPSRDILAAMELQMAAERKKRATILKSEGERMTLINEAEGNARAVLASAEAKRESIVLLAQAEAERLRIEADGLKESIERIARAVETSAGGGRSDRGGLPGKDAMDAALQLIMMTRYMETQAKFASSDGTKVLMFPTKESVPLTYEGLRGLLR
eukprot:CAMPEP_0194286648 /NCGR_PEP_ID=MMETSP0169-20130528/32961_1 /TAXON_ID=218684 /ORGANISM="Corethron pennatum, Strain L29A3" /LENGTH=342 /DNA_ID=CAMNT_0039033135 /DNA_START=13 /DNA_END=1041 /DNA_ORIENTATION=-